MNIVIDLWLLVAAILLAVMIGVVVGVVMARSLQS
jgi:ABC-type dipeptide/oligopeptide/nickel transport system permease component